MNLRGAAFAVAGLGAVLVCAPAAGAFEATVGTPPPGAYRVKSVETVEEGGETRRTTLTATARPPLRPQLGRPGPWRTTDLAGERRVETPRGPIVRGLADPRFGALATALLGGTPPHRVVDGTVVYKVPLGAVAGGTGTSGRFISLVPSGLADREGRRELDTAAHGRVTVDLMGMAMVVSYRASVSLELATGVPVRGELSWYGEQAGNRLFSRREIVTFERP